MNQKSAQYSSISLLSFFWVHNSPTVIKKSTTIVSFHVLKIKFSHIDYRLIRMAEILHMKNLDVLLCVQIDFFFQNYENLVLTNSSLAQWPPL
jgi:hypothetical protein